MKHKIELNENEFQFLNLVLNEVLTSPLVKSGKGYRPFAFYMIEKINGRPIYDKKLKERYEKYVEKLVKDKLKQAIRK